MNSLLQAAQARDVSWDADGSAASTAGSSTVGDRQNSCCASLNYFSHTWNVGSNKATLQPKPTSR
jgi:hypothetical protein